ncbi:probable sugar phosphate/phosphate translocator At1g48230 isoform X3 [Actinidia eriantha]|uniref:probable sugar phosphate/phosphate translocator At1g48230 isoform X3 n=1 Tax=Actinidia eriantha TaxID=165200 RepID=UPI00258B7554|nr:probable sugar phosphate/phosphate translocator At1g48230 isoform X3 [Actinidia eriantha]
MGKMINRSLLFTYLYLLIYILLSSGVILYNKWVLSPKYFNFPFPITLTMIHMGFSGAVAFSLVRVFKVVSPVQMTFEIYATCVIPISAFFASSLWFGNTAYLHISVAFIQMLKALMPVATFLMAVLCGTDKLSLSGYRHFCRSSEAGFDSSPPAKEGLDSESYYKLILHSSMQFHVSVRTLVLSGEAWDGGFTVIGRTGAVTIRVAGVLKDWILIALSTIVFPESTITGLNIIGYAIALCGVVMYNYLKVKDGRASQLPTDGIPERIAKDWKLEKKSSDLLRPDSSEGNNGVGSYASDIILDEEAPLIPSSRLSHIGRTQLSSHGV